MSKKASTGHVVSHTHWDREWRYPMWQTRLMLVEVFAGWSGYTGVGLSGYSSGNERPDQGIGKLR